MGYAGTYDAAWTPGRRAGHAARARRAKARAEALAWLMDRAFCIPGTRFRVGLDGTLGLIPGVGDWLTTALSAWILLEAYRVGAPGRLLARMLGNLAVDGLVGSIPIVGDVFDLAFRSSTRNMALLRRHLEASA
jgi:hypothetical protein